MAQTQAVETLATSSITLQNGRDTRRTGTIEKGSEIHTNPQVKNEGGIVMAGFGAEKGYKFTIQQTIH